MRSASEWHPSAHPADAISTVIRINFLPTWCPHGEQSVPSSRQATMPCWSLIAATWPDWVHNLGDSMLSYGIFH